MILIGSTETAARTRRHLVSPGGTALYRSTYIGTDTPTVPKDAWPAPGAFAPMAFLVEQQPHSVSQAHFHVVDQFQVVVDGRAMLGTHAVEGIAIHFTGPYSSYGPIKASEEGVHYFTLRNGFDAGANYVATSRAKLRAERTQPHREVVIDPDPALDADELAALRVAECREIIPMAADGLAAWRYRLPTGARLDGPDPATGLGQSWLVLGGTLMPVDSASLGRHGCLFVHPDDNALRGVAGNGGLEILCMQYPRH